MSSKVLLVALSLVFLFGCANLEKLAKQGMEKAKDAAEKYVDKEAGSGSFDDMMKLNSDQKERVLPYFVELNKSFDAKKITDEERTKRKDEIMAAYEQYKKGELSLGDYDKKASEIAHRE